MAGEGFVFDMIQTIRNNRRNRKKSNFYKNKINYLEISSKLQIDRKSATKEELQLIREKVRKKNRIKRNFDIVLYSILGLLFLCFLIWWFG